jgi:iron complex outermembrane receptor protein
MKQFFKLTLVVGSVAYMLALSGLVHAQNAPTSATASASESGGLEEITVTARKTSESLINVPVSVAVISQSAIANNDATDLSKLGELVPQVIIGTAATGTGAVLTIRGISSSPLDAGIDQSVSVDIDGVQVARGRIITASFFDTQQVEVLEGPQALFFGKNSPAGVISIHSVDPTNTLDGYIRGGYEFNADERFGEGAISGPLTDTLKARLAFRVSYQDGWIRNLAYPEANPLEPGIETAGGTGTTPRGHDIAGRLSVQWTPWDDFDAMLKVTADGQRLNSSQAFSAPFCTNGVTTQTTLGVPIEGTCGPASRLVEWVSNLPPQLAANYPYAQNGIQYAYSTATLASLVLNKRFEGVNLTSTTGYYQQTVEDAGTYDVGSLASVYDPEEEHYQLETQEIRATTDLSIPVNFTGGLYYEHFTRPHFNAPFLLDTGINPATGNYANNEQQAHNSGDTYSFFGQARWKIIPSVELAAGARWTLEDKDLSIGNIAINPNSVLPGLRPVGDFLSGHYSDHNVSPEATATWHPTDEQTLYAAYKTGYKSGGFSNTATLYADYTANSLEFKHEITKGFEIGYKSELLNRTLRINTTAYRYVYDDLQVSTYDPATISYLITNAGKALVWGFESQLEWLATSDLSFTGAAGYNRARFVSFPGAECYIGQTTAQGCVGGVQDLAGKPLPRAPDLTYDLGGRYRARPFPNWVADLSIDGAYSSSYVSNDEEDPNVFQPSFWRLNAAIHLHPANGKYDFAFIGRDLTNSIYQITTQSITFGSQYRYQGAFSRPRELILQAEYHF